MKPPVKAKSLMLSNAALEECRIPEAFWKKGVDDYFGNPAALKQVEHFIHNAESALQKGTGLLFRGKKFSGKTFLLTLALKSLMAKQFQVLYITFDELIESNLGNMPQFDRFNVKFFKTPFVAVDNVNPPPKHKHSEEVYTRSLLRFIRHRADSGLPFFIGTNLLKGEEDMFNQVYGDEIFDLVKNNTVTVKCAVDAYEMQKFYDQRKSEFIDAVAG